MFSLVTNCILPSCHREKIDDMDKEAQKKIARCVVIATLMDIALASLMLGFGLNSYLGGCTFSFTVSKVLIAAGMVQAIIALLFVSDQCRLKEAFNRDESVCTMACGPHCGPFIV